ncbi:ABC transporter ATP-binding protein [Hyphomicrobium sp. CS1GBMeth3]|uniref:ABC transporter ATP-binding protein n=1 Tax=Hyphomicrobium sp. CS1GBMeth3 TaxID=1892845 RepID=UPI000930A2A5|nr:ABC transporter ATP-binding protein [Hyphomicrobium sp. CS1GBMeth3]
MKDLSSYRGRPYQFIGRFIAAYPYAHAAIGLAVVAAVFCSVSTQYGVKYLVDALSGAGSQEKVWIGFALLAGLIAADNLLWRVASWIANSAFVDVSGNVRRTLFKYLTGHAPSYFQSQPPGALTSRITATSNALYTGETMVTFNVLPPLIATVVSVAYMATVSLTMAAVLALAGIAIGAFIFHYAARARPLHRAYANEAAAVDGQMVDVVSNMSLVKAFGRLPFEHRRLSGVVSKEMIARKRSLYALERLRIFHALATSLFTFALLAWVITLWSNGHATAGDVILVCTLGISVLSATRDLAVALVDVTQHLARLSEALERLLTPHTLAIPHGNVEEMPQSPGRIAFEEVSFSYPDGRNALSSVSFAIDKGEQIGIVGPSGGGKSTIFSLIQRFYEADSGTVLLDGQDVSIIPDEALRRAIGVVSQDVTLFHRSLRENIRYGRPGASDAEIWHAVEAARCDGFISAMPHGLDTVVGDRGAKLSGGQRQRIAIARAFLKNAPILLLDEATSALDADSEEKVREALENLMAGRTVLAIAHRLSTLRSFRRVIVVDQGSVIEDGPPEALLRSGGAYKAMVDLELSRLSGLRAA